MIHTALVFQKFTSGGKRYGGMLKRRSKPLNKEVFGASQRWYGVGVLGEGELFLTGVTGFGRFQVVGI